MSDDSFHVSMVVLCKYIEIIKSLKSRFTQNAGAKGASTFYCIPGIHISQGTEESECLYYMQIPRHISFKPQVLVSTCTFGIRNQTPDGFN